jgi:hypothetical protein
MGLINWIFDIYQHTQIERTREELARAREDLTSVRSSSGTAGSVDAERLERALGELALATKTVQRLLIEKGVCNQQELATKLRQIDMEDGRADGQAPIG